MQVPLAHLLWYHHLTLRDSNPHRRSQLDAGQNSSGRRFFGGEVLRNCLQESGKWLD